MNYFEQQAERQTVSPVKAKLRAKEKRDEKKRERDAERAGLALKLTPLQEKQAEKNELLRLYRKWRTSLRADIAAAHGADFAALMRLIRGLSWHNTDKVVDFVRNASWLRSSDVETRLQILSFIDSSLCNSRLRAGLPPMDDGLWDETPGPLVQVRRLLQGY